MWVWLRTWEDFWTLWLPGLYWTKCCFVFLGFFLHVNNSTEDTSFSLVSLCRQGDIAEQEGDSQSQGSATWLVDPKESKRTISTKYETTIFWVDLSSLSRPAGLALPHPPSFLPPSCAFHCDTPSRDPLLSTSSLLAAACVSSWKLHVLPDFHSTPLPRNIY